MVAAAAICLEGGDKNAFGMLIDSSIDYHKKLGATVELGYGYFSKDLLEKLASYEQFIRFPKDKKNDFYPLLEIMQKAWGFPVEL